MGSRIFRFCGSSALTRKYGKKAIWDDIKWWLIKVLVVAFFWGGEVNDVDGCL